MSLRRDLQALIREYEESKCNPAPFTSERALYERVHALAFPSPEGEWEESWTDACDDRQIQSVRPDGADQ